MNVSTKQRQIAELAGKYAGEPITSLHYKLDEPWLREAWRQVSRKTARKRRARALKAVGQWCRDNWHQPLAEQHRVLKQKLTGRFAYYGMTGNSRSLHRFREGVRRLWYKWLNRRTRRRDTLSWERFAQLSTRTHPLPAARIVHSIFRANPSIGGTGCVQGARPVLWGRGRGDPSALAGLGFVPHLVGVAPRSVVSHLGPSAWE